jgi:hypothetical protein
MAAIFPSGAGNGRIARLILVATAISFVTFSTAAPFWTGSVK